MHKLHFSAPLKRWVVLTTFAALSSIVKLATGRCSSPQTPDHAYLIYERHSNPPAYLPNGYAVRVVCEDRFKLEGEGNGFMICSRDGEWTNSASCTAICERLPCFQNGEITYSAGASIASYSCTVPGYRLKGNGTRSCMSDGTWSGKIPRCQGNSHCEQPEIGHLIHRRLAGRKTGELWVVGTIFQFSCDGQLGYPSDRFPAIKCTSRGWNSTIPDCSGIPKCEQPQLDQNIIQRRFSGAKLGDLWTIGTILQFSCKEPSRLVNDNDLAIECTSDKWNSSVPICRDTKCSPPLENIEHGNWLAENRLYDPGEVIEFTCDRGYKPSGSPPPQQVCVLNTQTDGSSLPMWQGETPLCEETQCPRPGNIEYGETIVSSTSVGGKTTFTCQPGFVIVGDDVISCKENGQWSGTIPSCYETLSLFNNEFGVDMYFLFDASNSVDMGYFEQSKQFAKSLVRQIGVTSSANSLRVGAVSFSYSPEVAFHTADFKSTHDVIEAINRIQFTGGGTDINKALILVKERMIPTSTSRPGSFKAIFLLTDGNAYVHGSSRGAARSLESIGISIYCVAIKGNRINWDLVELASLPHREHAFRLSDYGSINRLVAKVIYKPDYRDCGVSKNMVSRGRVVGGNDANPGAWPWQVLLEIRSGLQNLRCGGVLIDRHWVLTTASCVPRNDSQLSITVLLGVTHLDELDGRQEIEVVESIPHSDFNLRTFQNNIALLRLRRPANLNDFVRPVCLPNPRTADKLIPDHPKRVRGAVVTGWGHTIHRDVDEPREGLLSEPATILQQLGLPLRSRQDCQASLDGTPQEDHFDNSMFCAGFINAQRGACHGDAGGPLVRRTVMQNKRRWTLIGLTSWGRGCAVRNELDFFTNVPYFTEWITETMSSPQGRDEELEQEVDGQIDLGDVSNVNTSNDVHRQGLDQMYEIQKPTINETQLSGFFPTDHEFGVDLYFLFDAKTSTGVGVFTEMKRFAADLVRKIGVTSRYNSLRVGALVFSGHAEIIFHTNEFTSTNEVVLHGISRVQYTGGECNIANALRVLRESMLPHSQHREGSYKAAFLLTSSGKATEGGSPQREAMRLKRQGVRIYCAAFTEVPDLIQLQEICSQPYSEHLFFSANYLSNTRLVYAVINQTQDFSECGETEGNTISRGRVVGGNDASPGAWPWQALLEKRRGLEISRCGGVLIDRLWILTAASCLPIIKNGFTITVLLGLNNLEERSRSQEIEIVETISHSGFNETTLQNDIALLRLGEPAYLHAHVRTVCLPNPDRANKLIPANPTKRHVAIVTGWGHYGILAVGSTRFAGGANELQQLALPMKSRQDCRDSLRGKREFSYFDESMFCAGYINAQRGTCIGDGGGPLVKKTLRGGHRRWTVIGLTSWGRGCAVRNELDFFTNVPYFMDWITATMNQPQ